MLTDTSAALHGKRATLQFKLRDAPIAGNPTAKLRDELSAVDTQLAANAWTEASTVRAAEAAANEPIAQAATSTAAAIVARQLAALADIAIPGRHRHSRRRPRRRGY